MWIRTRSSKTPMVNLSVCSSIGIGRFQERYSVNAMDPRTGAAVLLFAGNAEEAQAFVEWLCSAVGAFGSAAAAEVESAAED